MEVTAAKDAPLVVALPLEQSLHLLLPTGAVRPVEHAAHANDPASAAFVLTAQSTQAPPVVEPVLGFFYLGGIMIPALIVQKL